MLGSLGFDETIADDGRGDLGVGERVDESLVVEYVALGGEEKLQDLVLDFLLLRLVGVDAAR